MRILLWHGYLLRGSGSNIYTANIARAWRSEGHQVLVLCQESDVGGLDFVDEAGAFDADNRSWTAAPTGIASGAGSCHVIRPDLGGLLPVYVYDDYPGFEVKTFVDLTDDELDDYTERNTVALRTAIARFDPEVIVTGHEVMGPYIAARATYGTDKRFIAKLHGSALEYAVKKQPRYEDYAAKGLGAAHRVTGGSDYMVRESARHIPGWSERAVVVNPGCDIDLFRPREVTPHPPTAGFVGKFIAAKGVHDLLAALPLVEVDDLRAVIVGYGGFDRELRAMAGSLRTGDVAAARSAIPPGADHTAAFAAFSDGLDDDSYATRARTVQIEFPGRLEHDPLSELLPTFDVLVVPSIVPEAFGMVAAEAAACAVLPVVPNHSGIGEVGATLESELGRPGLLVFDHTDPIRSLAERVRAVLSLSTEERRELGLVACEVARRRWSWGHVARRLLEVAQG